MFNEESSPAKKLTWLNQIELNRTLLFLGQQIFLLLHLQNWREKSVNEKEFDWWKIRHF